ncbi:programmed cell death protein 2 [Tribolium castaneum]|uniref:programmed cell death protein 2 n=1 Tax=Tribolium castaneum TaxID=7070 RepID=UPI0030FE928B
MSHVELGFSEECEPWQVESYQFPTKIGGKPAWLDFENLPKPENLQCETCHEPLIFLCQIYAPYEHDERNFHRTIFLFICRNPECCVKNSSNNVKAFRSSLPRRNKFYSFEPPPDHSLDFSPSKWVSLCDLCGCLGEKKCGKCKKATYCSREHQVLDWKQGHKSECEKGGTPGISSKLFPESIIVTEPEEIDEKSVDESEEVEKFNQLEREGKTGTMSDVSDKELEKYVCDSDKAFIRFKKRIGDNNDQILRYERGGEPLWIASDPKPDKVPNCEYCGNPRQYEFQIMPQLFFVLHENDLDVGIIIVYTCKESCVAGDNYKKEFVFKQDVK